MSSRVLYYPSSSCTFFVRGRERGKSKFFIVWVILNGERIATLTVAKQEKREWSYMVKLYVARIVHFMKAGRKKYHAFISIIAESMMSLFFCSSVYTINKKGSLYES